MEFKKIKDELYCVKNSGYELDLEAKTETILDINKNRTQDLIDSFYDLDGACLCENEEGELYAVDYGYINEKFVPIIWQKVKNIK